MNIKILVMDVDGTLTNGKVYISEVGEIFKCFDIKDGYGISVLLQEHNVIPVIITGRTSEIVLNRCKELGILHVYQGVTMKKKKLDELIREMNVSYDEVAYIGDDLNDIECMNVCGMTGCPGDAVEQVKQSADYVCSKNGGNGAVREFIEKIISGI